jgi:hypothetical protein
MDEPVSGSPEFSRTGLHGQANLEAGVAGLGLEADISFVVAGDYAAGDVQTKTGALSDIHLCTPEWSKWSRDSAARRIY